MNVHSLYKLFWQGFRKRRISLFFSVFGVSRETTVLDVGGTEYFWQLAEKMGLPVPRITIMNLGGMPAEMSARYLFVTGDGRNIPFGNHEFDLVFSNSVIEHLGGSEDRRRLAEEIRRVGRGYFVQTPDVLFPVEPHLLTPFIHWLPEPMLLRLNPAYTIRGLLGRLTELEVKDLKSVRLLGVNDVKSYFPDAEIRIERFCGIPKSIIALRKTGAVS